MNQDNLNTPNNNIANSTVSKKQKTKINLVEVNFLVSVVMVFYTLISGGGEYKGLGLLAAIMIFPFLCMPQLILYILRFFKKQTLFIFILKIVATIAGFVTTIITISMVNYKINIFVILNIILLIILLIDIIKNNKAYLTKNSNN